MPPWLRSYRASALVALTLSLLASFSAAAATVAYEVRRSTENDVATASLVGITTSHAFVDPTPAQQGAQYYYFVRAAGGATKDIRIFNNSIDATVFFPRTSSSEVPDLIYYTQRTSFSWTFLIVDDDSPQASDILWPEPGDVLDWIGLMYPGETALEAIGPDSDIDGDGLNNYLEFALATDAPETPASLPDYRAPQANAGQPFNLRVSTYLPEQRADLIVETSETLSDWKCGTLAFSDGAWVLESASDLGLVVHAEESATVPGYWTLQIEAAEATPKVFMRLAAPLPNE